MASDVCHYPLGDIELLFANEQFFKGMSATECAVRRQETSLPILNRIYLMAKMIASDAGLMGRDLLKKAVNYINNQTETVRIFILDGNAEISNNL